MTTIRPIRELTPRAQKILNTAAALFYARGIHAVGVDTIAAESGVTKRTLYDRFGSKDALVSAYLQERHDSWWAHVQERLASAESPRALVVFDAYVDSPLKVDRGCAFLNGAGELPRDHPGFTVIREHKHAVRRLLAELVADDLPHCGDAGSVAEHLYILLEGAIAHRGIDQGDDRVKHARALAQALLEEHEQHTTTS